MEQRLAVRWNCTNRQTGLAVESRDQGMTNFEHLGPYRVDGKLGQGGMGTVYRGVHVKTGQRVAIKVLAHQMSEQPRFRRRFANEIETLKKLKHPNIVRLIGYGEEDGLLFYSMELVEGPSLLEHLRKVKRLDWDTTIGYAIEICSALKHAHDFGVIHRDLKPANLLIGPEGHIKLTDFGIAKLFGSDEHTAAGSMLGTADYMAPEQASGGQVTPRTDLYALGSLIYACLVGRPPFGGRNLTQVIHGLKHETPAPLDLVLPEVPEELAELVHELLEKDPGDRPPTALVVSKRLAAMRAGLRHRGQQTRVDFASPTMPETPESVVSERLPKDKTSTREEARPDVANLPTAPEGVLGQATHDSAGFEATLASADAGEEFQLQDLPEEPRTRFETVPETTPAHTEWHGSDDSRHSVSHWISVLSLVTVLAVVIGLIAWSFRNPSPAELWTQIQQYDEAGDTMRAERAREDFVRLFPDDPRTAEVNETLKLDDASRMVLRLRGQAIRRGGRDALGPAAQGWLLAMEQRRNRPAIAAQRLRAWLDLFDHPAAQSQWGAVTDLPELTALARQELEKLEASGDGATDPRADALADWLNWGQENLAGNQRERFLRAARTLYAEEDWARPILGSADQP